MYRLGVQDPMSPLSARPDCGRSIARIGELLLQRGIARSVSTPPCTRKPPYVLPEDFRRVGSRLHPLPLQQSRVHYCLLLSLPPRVEIKVQACLIRASILSTISMPCLCATEGSQVCCSGGHACGRAGCLRVGGQAAVRL